MWRTHRLLLLCSLLSSCAPDGEDWPTWRFDETRSATSTVELLRTPKVIWVRQLPPLQSAYRNKRLQFDAGYEPIVLGELLFVASSHNDSVTALDARTGDLSWRFFTDGPVRFAPVGWKGKLYFGSDDGYLYCLDARMGTLRWKFRAVPSDRKVLGNGRLISLWPIRGGPVLADGVVYFAAGVWPSEGTFVYAVDAESGREIWRNDRSGFLYGQLPHEAEGFGGLTPQGYLVVDGDELIVPCGMAKPARFHRDTGRLKFFELPRKIREPGGWFASVDPTRARDIRHGRIVVDRGVNVGQHESGVSQGGGSEGIRSSVSIGGKRVSFRDGVDGVKGEVYSVIAARERLFVTTLDGRLYCLGQRGAEPPTVHDNESRPLERPSDLGRTRAQKLLQTTGVQNGYALVLGVGNGRLVEELALQSRLHVIGVGNEVGTVRTLRERLERAGLYGRRVSLLKGSLKTIGLPPYFANLIVASSGSSLEVLDSLRPYGGVACFPVEEDQVAATLRSLEAHIQSFETESVRVESVDGWIFVFREGALATATDYTGGWKSPDARVRSPFGVLWFGDAVRHFKRSPQPLFVEGTMISRPTNWRTADGPYHLQAPVFSDVYSGRVLTEVESQAVHRKIAPSLPAADAGPQPVQYRPGPIGDNPWKPERPDAGQRMNLLTGAEEPRSFPRSYGCDGGIDYGHLITMRSGTAAFYDKATESGTINISGIRSGCTNSVIPANGVLNVPYFVEACTCSYPLPLGLALMTMPETHEQWASWGESPVDEIHRVGINFGAPGDRATRAGTLWIEEPSVGGSSPKVRLGTKPEALDIYYHHAVWVRGGHGWPWVVASGVRGLSELSVGGLRNSPYTIRLFFAEPEENRVGERVFDVSIQGSSASATVIENLDVLNESGGRMRGLVKEFTNVPINGELLIRLSPRTGKSILAGVELIAEGLEAGALPVLEDRDTTTLQRRR